MGTSIYSGKRPTQVDLIEMPQNEERNQKEYTSKIPIRISTKLLFYVFTIWYSVGASVTFLMWDTENRYSVFSGPNHNDDQRSIQHQEQLVCSFIVAME